MHVVPKKKQQKEQYLKLVTSSQDGDNIGGSKLLEGKIPASKKVKGSKAKGIPKQPTDNLL